MQKIFVVFLVIIILGVAVFFIARSNESDKIAIDFPKNNVEQRLDGVTNMRIVSSAFDHNAKIPSKYTCDGENVNPPLQFLDIPKGAKSLVLIVDDPDAAAAFDAAPSKAWVHWVVYNINPQISEVAENSVPEGGIEGMTDFGKHGYGGPCPPSGVHRYFFKLYALDSVLDLLQKATKQMVEEKMQGHILDKAELIGLYSKK